MTADEVELEATIGLKINLGNYESGEARGSIRRTVRVKSGEEARTAWRALYQMAKEEAERQAESLRKERSS